MSILNHFHTYEFFKNKEMNHFYLMIMVVGLAEALISLFVPIYLYQSGYSVKAVILFYFLASLAFAIFAYPGAKIVTKIGIKKSFLWSTPLILIYYLGLRLLNEESWLFFALPLVLGWRNTLYNFSYHLSYVTRSDGSKRGREVSFIQGIGVVISVLAPLAGGLIASLLSFSWLYLIGAALLVLGTFPLFLRREEKEELTISFKGLKKELFSKEKRGNLISFSGYAVESIIGVVIWPVFLFMILKTVEKTGLIVTLSTALSLIVFYIVGRITDRYDKSELIKWGTLFYFLGWTGRIFANSTLKILIIDSYKNISERVLQIPWAAKSYDLATKENYFQFIVGREVAFSLSRIVMLPLLMLIFYLDFYPFIISFIIAAWFSLGYTFLDRE